MTETITRLKPGGRDWQTTETMDPFIDYVNRVDPTVTISSAVWTATLRSDGSNVTATIVSGSSTNSGTKSINRIHDPTDGDDYLLKCAATMSDGEVLDGFLLVACKDET